jgi:hypothetical protein
MTFSMLPTKLAMICDDRISYSICRYSIRSREHLRKQYYMILNINIYVYAVIDHPMTHIFFDESHIIHRSSHRSNKCSTICDGSDFLCKICSLWSSTPNDVESLPWAVVFHAHPWIILLPYILAFLPDYSHTAPLGDLVCNYIDAVFELCSPRVAPFLRPTRQFINYRARVRVLPYKTIG